MIKKLIDIFRNIRLQELFRIFLYLKKRKKYYFIGLFGFSTTEAVIYMIIPFIMKYMTDAAVIKDIGLLKQGLILISIVAILISILFVFFAFIFRSNTEKNTYDIRMDLFHHLASLSINYYEKTHSGNIHSHVNNDIFMLHASYGLTLRELLTVIITSIGSLTAMLILNWKVSLVLIAIAVFSTVIIAYFSKKIRDNGKNIQEFMGKLTEKSANILSGFKEMKMFHIETDLLKDYRKENDKVFGLYLAQRRYQSLVSSFNFLASWLNFAGLIALGAILYQQNLAGFGTIIALMRFLTNFNSMLKKVGTLFGNFQNNLAGADRIFNFLDQPPEPAKAPVHGFKNQSMIEMEKVIFYYQSEKPVLNEISMNIKKGEVAALVGPSGSGKSTIIKLLLGFYFPQQGMISLDKKAMSEYNLSELRSLMAYVPQDSYVFDGTIEENIGYGNAGATKDEIIDAAGKSYAHDFINELPEKYQTRIGEKGVKLSGGERQRIAIARALLKRAPILLLDEATSSLDSHSETLVQKALDKLMQGRAVLTVAHRLSTIEHADIIYFIDKGRIIESGSHNELIKRKGCYYEMFNMQYT